jgi:hypothetical protein
MKDWFERIFKRFRRAEPATNFVHIPKTAGTSFIVWLDRFFPAERIFPHQLWREVRDIDPAENQTYELYRGHFGGGGVRQLTHRPLASLTILRDPVELAKSTYQYVLREQNTRVHRLLKTQDFSLRDFISHPQTQPLVTNRLIRNLSFDFAEDPDAQEVFLSAETVQYLQQHLGQGKQPLADGDRLKRAKAFLQQAHWFGLAERFNESMQLLSFVNAWRPMGSSQKLNTSPGIEVSATCLEHIKSLNAEDLAFYRWAAQLFDERFAHMQRTLEQYRNQDTQSLDDLLDAHYQAKGHRPLARDVDYRFNQVLQGQQWHRREWLDAEQGYFRWTGPGPVSDIDFWVQPGDQQLTMRLINATSTELLDDLQLSVNGHRLPWESTDQGVVRVLTAAIPGSQVQANGLLRLSISCSAVRSHQEAFGSDDERLVGVAVHWIQLKHVG